MRKNRKKWIVLGVVALLAVVLVVRMTTPKPVEELALATVPLSRMDLQSTVDATGNVQSQNSVSVYSSQNYPVRQVLVEVGDTVEEGDLLCQLDSASLELDIAAKQATMSNSSASAALTLQQAQDELERARQDLEEGNSDAVRDAREKVEEAERLLRQAKLETNMARDNLEEARRENRRSDEEVNSTATINSYRSSLNRALIAEEDAEAALALAEEKLERALEDAQKLDLASYEDKVATAELAADLSADQIALTQLRRDLAECTVTAPASGTVTAVYATVGSSGSGLLFVIEDLDNLEVSTSIKEYDIGQLMLGDRVLIKTDGVRGEVYEGELSHIAPTTTKPSYDTVTGEKETTTDAEFAAEIRVTSPEHRLLVGMTARLNIVVDERSNVFAVSYDMLEMNELGEDCIYIAEENGVDENGEAVWVVRMIPVTLGLETDFYTEIISDQLTEGMLLLADTLGLQDGDPVTIQPPLEVGQ